MENLSQIVSFLLAVALAYIALKIFTRPIRLVLKLLLNILIGFAALAVINFLGGFVGVYLDMNWLNAAVAGIFGIPGIAVLLIINILSA